MFEENRRIISVKNISKKYCRDLNRSLRYPVKDIVAEVMPKMHFFPHNKSVLREGESWAVKDMSFELRRGASLAIVGENGAGKRTFLKVPYGLIKPDTGEIRILRRVGEMITLIDNPKPLSGIAVDEPTIAMIFGVNTSPFS